MPKPTAEGFVAGPPVELNQRLGTRTPNSPALTALAGLSRVY